LRRRRWGGRLGFGAVHGLSAGQGVSSGGEVRFVEAIVDTHIVQLKRAVHDVARGWRDAGEAAVTYQTGDGAAGL